jgi:serine/threonine-protein kinase
LTTDANLRGDSVSDKWLPVWVTAAAVVFCGVDFARHYAQLPQRMASHFDARGQPDGWSSKGEFFAVVMVTFAVVGVAVGAIPLLVRFAPGLVNLPNKKYWLAPERQAETLRFMSRWGLWFAAATLWLLALVFHESILANLRQPPRLENIWWLLGGYLAVVAFLLVRLLARFWPAA